MNVREERGKQIVEKHEQITRIDENHYQVNSQSRDKRHDIVSTELGWSCSCEDYRFRKIACKHIHAVEISLRIRSLVKERVVMDNVVVDSCIHCNSDNIGKWTVRHNKTHDIQVYRCRDCSRYFSVNLGFERMHASPQVITSAMQLYFTGESLRGVQKFLRLQGVEMSHVAVYKWVKKYTGLMDEYLKTITPQVGDKWHADEVWLKVKGDRKYLFAMMDSETRSPAIAGIRLYHNYVRPHMGLDGDTPAERAGIEIRGRNKWQTIIQNAAKRQLTGRATKR